MANLIGASMVVHAGLSALGLSTADFRSQLPQTRWRPRKCLRVHTTVWEGTSNLETVAQKHRLR